MTSLADAYSEAHLDLEPFDRDADEATQRMQELADRWEEILAVTARITVDAAAANREITERAERWQEQVGEIVVNLVADTTEATAEISAFDSFIQEIADTTIVIGAEADTAQATLDIETAIGEWEALVETPVTAMVDMDTGKATADLAASVEAWDELVSGITVAPSFDGSFVTAQLESSVSEWQAVSRFDVEVGADTGLADSKIAATLAAAEALASEPSTINLRVDSGTVVAELETIAALIDTICVGCTIEIDVDLGTSLADLAALRAAVAEACGSQTIDVNVDTSKTKAPLDEVTRATRNFADRPVHVPIDVDASTADATVAATGSTWSETLGAAASTTASFDVPESVFRDVLGLEALLGSVPDDVRTTFSGNTEEVIGEVSALRVLIEQLDQKTIDVTASVTANQASIVEAAALIDGGIPDDLTTTIGIDLADLRARLTAATSEFAAERDVWEELARIQAHFGIDSTEATAEIEAFHTRAERLGSIKADVEAQVADAIVKLTAVETLVDSLDGRNVDIAINTNSDDMQRLLASLADAPAELDKLTDSAQGFNTVLGDLQRAGTDIEFHARVTGVPEALAAMEGLEVARKKAQIFPADVLDIPAPDVPAVPDVPTAPDVKLPNLVRDAEAVAESVKARQLDAFEKEFSKSSTNKLLSDLGGERSRTGLADLSRTLKGLGFKEEAANAKAFSDRLRDITDGTSGKELGKLEKFRKSIRDIGLSVSDVVDRAKEGLAPVVDRFTAPPANLDAVKARVGAQSVGPQLTQFANKVESGLDVVGKLDMSTAEAQDALDQFSALAHETVGSIRANVEANTGEAAAKLRRDVPELQRLLDTLQGTVTLDDNPANLELQRFIDETRRSLHFSSDVDTSAISAELEKVSAQADSTLNFLATMDLNDDEARTKLDLFVDREREKLSGIDALIGVNDREALAKIETFAAEARREVGKIVAPIAVDEGDAVFELEATMVALEREVRAIDIPVNLQGEPGLEAHAIAISETVARLLGSQNIDVDLRTTGAVADVGFLRGLYNRLLGRIVTDVDVDGKGATVHAVVLAKVLNKILSVITINPLSGGVVSKFFAPLIKGASTAISTVSRTFRGITGVLSSVLAPIGRVASSIFSPIGRIAGSVFSTVGRAASTAFGAVVRAATPLISVAATVFGAVADGASKAFSVVTSVLGTVGDVVGKALGSASEAASGLWDTISGPAGQAGKVLGIFAAIGVAVGGIGGAVAALVPLLLGLVGLAGGFLTLAGGLSLAAGAAGVLGIALNKDLLTKVTDGLKDLKTVVAGITRPIGEAIINNFLQPLLGSLATLVERAAPLAELFIGPIATAALNFLNTFSGLLSTVDASKFISGFAEGIGGLINTFASYLQPFLAAITSLNGPAFTGFQAIIKTILDLGLAFTPVAKQIFDLLTNTQGPLTAFGTKAAEVFERLFTGLNKIISSEMFRTLLDFLITGFSGLERFLKGFAEGFQSAEGSTGGFASALGTLKVVMGVLVAAAPVFGTAFSVALKLIGLSFKPLLLIIQQTFSLIKTVAKVVLILGQQIASALGLVASTALNVVSSILDFLPDALIPDGWVEGVEKARKSVDGFRKGVNDGIGGALGNIDSKFGDIDGRLSGLFTTIDTGVVSPELEGYLGNITSIDGGLTNADGSAKSFFHTLDGGADSANAAAGGIDASAEAALRAAEQFRNTTGLLDAMREKFSKPLELSVDFSKTKLDLASLIQFDSASTDATTGVVTPAKLTKGINDAITQAEEDAARTVKKVDFLKGLRLNGLNDLADQVEKLDGPALEAVIAEIGDFAGAGAKKMEERIDAATKTVLVATNPIQAAVDKVTKDFVLQSRQAQIVAELETNNFGAVASVFASLKPEDLEAAIASYEVLGPAGISALETQLDSVTTAGQQYVKDHNPLDVWFPKSSPQEVWDHIFGGNPASVDTGAAGKAIGDALNSVTPSLPTPGKPATPAAPGAPKKNGGFFDPSTAFGNSPETDAAVKQAAADGAAIVAAAEKAITDVTQSGIPAMIGAGQSLGGAFLAGVEQSGANVPARVSSVVDSVGVAFIDQVSAGQQKVYAAGFIMFDLFAQGVQAGGISGGATAAAAAVIAIADNLTITVTTYGPELYTLGQVFLQPFIDGLNTVADAPALLAGSAFIIAVVSGIDTAAQSEGPVLATIGRNMMAAIGAGMLSPEAIGLLEAVIIGVLNIAGIQALGSGLVTGQVFSAVGTNLAANLGGGIGAGTEGVLLNIIALGGEMVAEINRLGDTALPAAGSLGASIGRAISEGISSGLLDDAATKGPAGVGGGAGGAVGKIGGGIAAGVTGGLSSQLQSILAASALTAHASGILVGVAIGTGVLQGMVSTFPLLLLQAQAMGILISQALRGVLKVKSPSKVTYEIGVNVATGMAAGIDAGQTQAVASAKALGQAVADAADPGTIAPLTVAQPAVDPARKSALFGSDPFAGGLYKPSDLTPDVHNFFDQLNKALDTNATVGVSDRDKLDELITALGESGFQTSVVDANHVTVVDPRDLARQFTLLAQGFQVGAGTAPPLAQPPAGAAPAGSGLVRNDRPGQVGITEGFNRLVQAGLQTTLQTIATGNGGAPILQIKNAADGGTIGFQQNEDGLVFKTLEELLRAIASGQGVSRDQFFTSPGFLPPPPASENFPIYANGVPSPVAASPGAASSAGISDAGVSSLAIAARERQRATTSGPLVNIEHMDVHSSDPEGVPDAIFKQVEPAAWRAGAWGM